MKKTLILLLGLIGPLLLTGCSVDRLQQQVTSFFQDAVEQDQEHQQGFADLTRTKVYERYQVQAQGIDLASLNLSKMPDLCELVYQSDHEKIRHISLANNNIKVVDTDLSCFTNLETLNLSYNNIQTVVALGDLPNLEQLILKKNELTSTSGLPELPSLEKLSLAYNDIRRVVGLDEKYTNLKELELQHNVIQEVIGIENMQTLEQIKLEFNNLESIDFLESLNNLELATAKGNEIADELLKKWNELNQQFVEERMKADPEGSNTMIITTGSNR